MLNLLRRLSTRSSLLSLTLCRYTFESGGSRGDRSAVAVHLLRRVGLLIAILIILDRAVKVPGGQSRGYAWEAIQRDWSRRTIRDDGN